MILWKPGKLFLVPHTETRSTVSEGNGTTLSGLVSASHERGRLGLLIALLTLTAGWTDMLAYFSLGHVFASFLTGNVLYIGLGVGQGNNVLLLHALTAIFSFLVGVTVGSFYLARVPKEQTNMSWYRTFARCLMMEWVLLLAFAILWLVTGNQSQQTGVQYSLLCLTALGMGVQGGLVMAFSISGVVADALTATLIVLGQRLAQDVNRSEPQGRDWRWGTLFLVLLCLIYTASALVVALSLKFILTPVVPVIVVTLAIVVLLVPVRQAMSSLVTSSSETKT